MVGGKGLFVKELEVALLQGKIDLAVHSMKDLPATIPDGLEISVVSQREDARDVLISSKKLNDLLSGHLIGTSSLRRQAQIKNLRPDLNVSVLRGNIETRIRKIQSGEYDAGIMALAGIKRLGLEYVISEVFPTSQILPAVGQGALGLETRCNDTKTIETIQQIHHEETALCIEAERAFLKTTEGNCQVPIAGYCQLIQNQLVMNALIGQPDGRNLFQKQKNANLESAKQLGQNIAKDLLEAGGKEILDSLKKDSAKI